uniref:Uncharacterized protein n=1 Tax=Grammatophora oceanica TaxID=210454 RepID=A0A7S1V1X3_9STRA|mmetsp:Transcript_31459/g.46682  ORF Transcript_31459/g.46682 Transcript_31459/m.46682 type:complete len:138 (+) Transcript_31459:389-802(+)|eukprot:CAMPEP_0194050712 /NCGR_PEP_ID=MMETSP0009_2-20130614/36704_1 /TAXON_ID=210454 /ORGANISM="Grammatophora oceanica, Strain CCMP 410" /LENGTH=137 /DNA_ID=CAMNT_0038697481 /DNA_START=345 /DNA_END=758 /DNA_ORIENTATION=+
MMMIKNTLLVMVLAHCFSVTGANKNIISCEEAMEDGILEPADDIVDANDPTSAGGFAFSGFPCGTTKFFQEDDFETLGCQYNTKFNEYECVSEETKAKTIVEKVLAAFAGANQPCAAKGFKLDGRVKPWWWLCVKEE